MSPWADLPKSWRTPVDFRPAQELGPEQPSAQVQERGLERRSALAQGLEQPMAPAREQKTEPAQARSKVDPAAA
jgi:hypothetical protein